MNSDTLSKHVSSLYLLQAFAFLNYCAPTNVDVFVEYGMWETFTGDCSLVVIMVSQDSRF